MRMSRLEEIKSWLDAVNGAADTEDAARYDAILRSSHEDGHTNWLIRQAKLKQEVIESLKLYVEENHDLNRRVGELEEENRNLNNEIRRWSTHVWAIAEESFVVGSKAKQLLNEMLKGESE